MSSDANQHPLSSLADSLRERFAEQLSACTIYANELTIEIVKENILEVCTALCKEPGFAFAQLVDLCGVDYIDYGKDEWTTESATSSGFSRGVEEAQEPMHAPHMPSRFSVVYHLLSHKHNERLRIKTFLDGEQPVVDSVIDIYPSANWYEREAFDLYGILFNGHPDLRRILTDYGFIGHPFRKDFPLSGHVEMRYDADKKRVVYQPVSIEERVLVPRVIRDDSRYLEDENIKQQ